MPDDFRLHPMLERDTLHVTDLALCQVRLMNDARFPWLVLVPRRADCRELIDLGDDDRRRLTEEIDHCTRVLLEHTVADKMNVASLGNQVAQLHVHVIARFESDSAWPGPVWGTGAPSPYPNDGATQCAALARALTE